MSFLQNNKFQVSFNKIPNVVFNAFRIAIPGMVLPSIKTPNPFSKLTLPNTQITYEPLAIDFLLDEEMDNYFEIYNWMIGTGFPESFQQRKDYVIEKRNIAQLYGDCTVSILNNSNRENRQFIYHNVIPTYLSGFETASANPVPDQVVIRLQLDYDYFTLK